MLFLLNILLTICLAIFQFSASACPEEERIEPVELNYFCVPEEEPGIHFSKSPVLLIHGLASSLIEWDGFYQNLSLRIDRTICLIDLRNHGDSPWNNRTDVASNTVDVIHFLNERGIGKVNLIGHSLGGKIAVDVTLKHPDRVCSLVVEDMRPNGITDLALYFVRQVMALYLDAINKVPANATKDEAVQIIITDIRETLDQYGYNYTVTEEQIQIRNDSGKWEWKFNLPLFVEELKDPEKFLGISKGLYEGKTLFFSGDESPFDVKGDEANITKLFPKAKIIEVPNASHAIHGLFKVFEDKVVNLLNRLKWC